MDIKKLATLLIWIGVIVTFLAFIWWGTFYGQMGGNIRDANSCLYSSSGPCGIINGLLQFGDVTPYNPIVFWIGVIMLGIGTILNMVVKEEGASE